MIFPECFKNKFHLEFLLLGILFLPEVFIADESIACVMGPPVTLPFLPIL
jgi:hypothetical protein